MLNRMEALESRILSLPKIADPRGNLSIIEQIKQIPFEIKRVHWVYDVPGGFDRGGHAYFETEEFIVALSGSFDIIRCAVKTVRIRITSRREYLFKRPLPQ